MKDNLKELLMVIVCLVFLTTIHITYKVFKDKEQKESKIELLKTTIDLSSLNYEIDVVKFYNEKGKITPKQLDSLRIESNRKSIDLVVKVVNKNE
jgi:hypothetical protein